MKFAPSMKKSSSIDPSGGSVDIFKSNRLIDQKKLFDEFDELFEKNNKNIARKKLEEEEEEVPALKSPSFAFRRLNELKKFPSSSFSISTDESDDKKEMKLISAMTTTAAIPDFNLKSTQQCGDYLTATSKPKIISEQKKILYYNDENELQDLIMKRMSSKKLSVASEIIESNEDSASSLDCKSKQAPSMSLSSSQQVIAAHSNSTKSNSLKIFSNEGIFVFNL